MTVKDYILQVKVKNGPMLSAMRANGMQTAADLSRSCGVDQATIGLFLNLLNTPIGRKGDWKPSIMKIAEALNVVPEMLFPEQHLSKALTKNKAEIEMDLEDMEQLTSGISSEMVADRTDDAQTEMEDLLRKKIRTLTEREEACLSMRFGLDSEGPMILDDVGAKLGVGRERVRQIEAKALRKLRHPSRMGSQRRMEA
jgi:DNA-directed RNA polymerase sigma subunit (sigma70/sigma32)